MLEGGTREWEDFAAEDEVNVALVVHHKSFPVYVFLLYFLTSGLTPESPTPPHPTSRPPPHDKVRTISEENKRCLHYHRPDHCQS